MAIDRFADEYYWLSNFAESPMVIGGLFYPTVEHFFQSKKTIQPDVAAVIRNTDTPGGAKSYGRVIQLRDDWEKIKDDVMYMGVTEKFLQNPKLAQKLLETGDEMLIEGNNWHDYYWGVCNGKGQNKLGQILMRVREELRNANNY